ncbi:hypothetical protein ACFX19_041055 [Malus domestica]
MSFNQSTSDKNETQYRKTGRSASSNQQHRGYSPAYPKGTGATVSVTNVSPQVSGMAPAQRGGVQNGAHAQPQLHAPGAASKGVSIQVGMSMPMPFHQPQVPVQFGGPNQQIQYQSMSTSSIQMPMPMQLPIRSTQVQQPVFDPGLQPHPMQPQGIMHQSQNLTFTPQMGPQIPQMGNLGISMASQCPQQQGSNFGVLRDPCSQTPVQQHVRGILPGPAHSVRHQGGMQRNNSEADRWQRATNFQPKGLMPSPHTPLQVMHQSDRKNGVGKVRDEEQAKQRQLRAILNKLTPQNFEKLFEQVKAVNIDNATTLTGVVSQIFDKALMRPTFCEMYANFCFYLAGELPDFSEDNEKITFRRLLLNKCQEEFDRGEREQEEANKADEEGQVKQSEEEREEKRIKGRRRMLGNISLIGELYKKRMLTERVMHECIKKMLGQQQTPDEGDIEALCKLMSTIGEMIDHPKAKEHMDAYFERMKSLSNNLKLSSRVRFMLKDAIDLRKNKWQQRSKVEGPKKIEEVHRDAAQELQAQSSRLARGPGINPSARRGPPMEFSPRGSTMLSSPNAHMKLTPQNYEKLFEQRHQADRKNEVGKVSDEEQVKQRQLKAIVNKLTPQNFEKLFEQVKAVNIDNATTLTGVISHIFDKALMEPTLCEMYANFCFYLAGELPDFSEDNEKITFRRLLLNKCQEEFERGEREQEEANKADEEGQVKQSEEEREEKRIKGRRRMLGNISLIGELYKKRMLIERVMHECIKKMLGQQQTPDEGDIEALCKLMSTIGEMIDHPKAKEHMDAYFERMKSLSNNLKLSSRVRFMLKDAIDLRKNKWQQRSKVEGPKKIEEVHRDAAQELQAQSSRLARGPGINPSARRGPRMEFSPRGSTMLSSPNAHMKLTPQNYEKLFEQRHQADRKNEVGKVSDEEQVKQRQLKAIVNKLTPQNFEKLFEQVKAVNIDNATTLTGVISHIFDKALMEPTLCEMYANFCFYLAGELPDFSEDNEKITFRRLLLNKCQEEFERGEREQEEANKADEEGQVKQSEEEREEKRIKGRRRMWGNIRLIGELYKKKMLTERIMHECIKKMLGQQQTPDEEDIEALCKLMSTIGEMIDHPKAKEHMDAYFERMKSLSNNMKLSSRVRFMLKDAIDLRKSKWQQRSKVEGPKKIEEVHRDAAQELQAQSSRLARGPGINPSARRRPRMEFSPRGSTMLSSPNAHMKLTPQNYEKLFEQRHQADRKNEVGKVSDEEQVKQRQLKAIVNKLTPQNFEKLFEQVKAVNIDNATTLTGVISHIFDKALMEPTLCEMYANFCFYLAGELPDFSEDNEKITFRRLLLNKCQEEFERGEREQEEANKADEEGQVKQSEEEREEKRIKGRRRMWGNIRLIGELYKKKMLTERIMHECIKKMLGQQQTPDEEDIEALCKLMSTIGEMIDHPKAKEHMDAYFERMKSLSNNLKLSSRVRFMLKDAIDLRKNKWQQRSKVEGPKKIEEVHRDAAQELQAQSSRLARGPGINPSARRRPRMEFSPRGSTMLSSSNAHMGGFRGMPAQVRGYGSQDVRTDERHSYESRTLSVPLTQRPIGDDSITLGPQGGLARGMSIRGPPSMSAAPLAEMPPSAGDSRRMTAGSNGFSSLSERTTYNPREDPVPRYMPDRFSGPAAYDQSSVSERNLSFGGRDLRSSDHRTLPTSPPTRAYGAALTKNVPSENVLTEDRLRDMSLAAIREFYSARDEKEVALCIKELNSPSFHPSMISLWITDSFERKDAERDLLAKLLVNLTKTNDATLSQSQLIKGFETVLSTLEDTVIDTPRAPEFLGLIFAKVILENVVSLNQIGQLIHEGGEEPRHLLEVGLAGNILGNVLEIIKSEKGDNDLNDIRTSSNLRLETFRPPDPLKSRILEKFI